MADKVKVHVAIARALSDNMIDTMFGVVGDANLYIVDSFTRDYHGSYVAAANEAGAALMALGYAGASGRVGVATVTHGPGLTNTLTALVEGVKGQTPMLLVCGDTPVEDKENMQNIPQRDVVIATGAGFEQMRSAAAATEDVATAIRRALVERRPIVLNIPADLQWQEVDYKLVRVSLANNRAYLPAGEDLDNAVGVIAAAKRPIVLAGRGAIDPESRAAILMLADRIGAPIATTLKAKGLFRNEDFDLGIFGTLSTIVAADIIAQSDCIISFGASLNKHTTARGAYLAGKRVLQVNLEQGEIGKYAPIDVGLVGDPALTARNLIYWLDEAEIGSSKFRSTEMRRRLESHDPTTEAGSPGSSRIDIVSALLAVDLATPPNRILVTDGGRFVLYPWKYIGVPDPRSSVYSAHFGSIGLGLSHAIGAARWAPDRPVLAVIGDGGFMLGGLAEFNTAVRHRIDLIVVICNDGSYGAEHVQLRNKSMDPALSIFEWPEFADVAVSLGGEGFTVRTSADLDRLPQVIKKRCRPLLIDLKLDPDAIPVIS